MLDVPNEFGETKLDMDVQTDSLIYENLKKSKEVCIALSEERPYPTILNKKGSYNVTFDPIDGSNIIENNFTVGSIFGIWPKGDINGMSGREMVGAAVASYGSRTGIIVYNTNNNQVEEWTLRELEGDNFQWEKTRAKIKVSKQTKIFSPANSRAILDNIAYR